MKAKYKHCGNYGIIYNYIICVDDIVMEVESYAFTQAYGTPQTKTTVLDNKHKAIEYYNKKCDLLEFRGYGKEYRD